MHLLDHQSYPVVPSFILYMYKHNLNVKRNPTKARRGLSLYLFAF